MKEATGELSNTVITVVAIAAILTLFTVFLYPSLKAAIRARTYCQSSVQCGACDGKTMECHYYDDNMQRSKDTITCDCETKNETKNETK